MKAQAYAKKFVEENGKPEILNEVYNMFKILLIPEKVLVESFVVQGAEGMGSAYRKFAMVVHPDKNPHPYSQTAFQKLSNAFNDAKKLVA